MQERFVQNILSYSPYREKSRIFASRIDSSESETHILDPYGTEIQMFQESQIPMSPATKAIYQTLDTMSAHHLFINNYDCQCLP